MRTPLLLLLLTQSLVVSRASLAQPALTVVVRDTGVCPPEALLVSALRERFGDRVALAAPAPGAYSLEVHGSGEGEVFLTLSDADAPPATRRLTASPQECLALAETITWIAEAWARESPRRLSRLLPHDAASATTTSAPGTGTTGAGALPNRAARKKAKAEPSPSARAPVSSIATPQPLTVTALPQEETVVVDGPSRQAEPAPLGLRVTALGGLQAPDWLARAAFGAAVEVEKVLASWLAVGLHTELGVLNAAAAPGQVSLLIPSALAMVRVGHAASSTGLSAVVGVGGQAVFARSSGFDESGSKTLWGVVALVAAQLRLTLVSSLSAVISVGVTFQGRQEQLTVTNVGTVLTLQRIRPFAAGGLSCVF